MGLNWLAPPQGNIFLREFREHLSPHCLEKKGHGKGLFNSFFAFLNTIYISFVRELWITGAVATIWSQWVKRNSPELKLLPTLLGETDKFWEEYAPNKHLLGEVSSVIASWGTAILSEYRRSATLRTRGKLDWSRRRTIFPKYVVVLNWRFFLKCKQCVKKTANFLFGMIFTFVWLPGRRKQ